MKKNIILSAIFGSFFILILVMTIVFIGPATEINRRVLFYYNDIHGKVVGNVMGIRSRVTLEQDIKALINHLLALPLDNAHLKPLFGATGEVFLVSLVGNNCFIDIRVPNVNTLVKQGNNFEQDIMLIKQTILFNFPSLSAVSVTINGQVPFAYSFF